MKADITELLASVRSRMMSIDEARAVLLGDTPTVSDLVEERNQLREWVTALVGAWPPLGDNYECLYCRHTRYLCDPANHEPDCPWRLAAEYIERLEAQDVATD